MLLMPKVANFGALLRTTLVLGIITGKNGEVWHVYSGGGTVKDVYLEQINVSNGGKSLVEDSELTLAHGRRYGIVGRNGARLQCPAHTCKLKLTGSTSCTFVSVANVMS
jgi:hypothetical protein